MNKGKILVVDQVAGDLSLLGAGANSSVAERIVATARERGVLDRLVLRAHPDDMILNLITIDSFASSGDTRAALAICTIARNTLQACLNNQIKRPTE